MRQNSFDCYLIKRNTNGQFNWYIQTSDAYNTVLGANTLWETPIMTPLAYRIHPKEYHKNICLKLNILQDRFTFEHCIAFLVIPGFHRNTFWKEQYFVCIVCLFICLAVCRLFCLFEGGQRSVHRHACHESGPLALLHHPETGHWGSGLCFITLMTKKNSNMMKVAQSHPPAEIFG